MTRNILLIAILTACTVCLGAKPDDYSWVRGVNYHPFVSKEVMAKELGYGRRVNLNTIRFWLSYHAWKANPDAYARRVGEAVRNAKACGYKSMPILFNGNMAPASLFDDAELADQERYVKAITSACAGSNGILMWDVMNEPDCCNHLLTNSKDEAERRRNEKKLWDWLRAKCRLVKQCDSAILDACEHAANLLEASELVPMSVPPTAKINTWRKMKNPPIDEIRPFAFELAETLRRQCLIID